MNLAKIEFKKVGHYSVQQSLLEANSVSSGSITRLRIRMEPSGMELKLKMMQNNLGHIVECRQDVMMNVPMNHMDVVNIILHHHRLQSHQYRKNY